MLQQPKHIKFSKFRKGRLRQQLKEHAAHGSINPRHGFLQQGDQGLCAKEGGRLSARQIEATRKVITKALERTGKLYLRSFPDRPITSKSLCSRMGKGKGIVSHYVAVLQPGQIIFEIKGVDKNIALFAFKKASKKIPLLTSPIIRVQPLQP